MVLSLVEQLRRGQVERGWSTQELLERSGLEIERSVLHRKLTGKTPATAEECEALSLALGMTLVYPTREGAA